MPASTISVRIRDLCDTNKFFDVEFVLKRGEEKKTIKGHKAIFASCSTVFEKMLFGELAEGSEIAIEDIEPDAFASLKKYIYTDEVDFMSVQHAKCVYEAADKYNLMELLKEAENYLSSNLSSSTVFRVLEFSRTYQKVDFEKRCVKFIRNDTVDVLNSDDFLHCDVDIVNMIVNEGYLNISEFNLFKAIENWANSNTDNKETSSPSSEIPSLKKVISKIRFLSMTTDEFTEGPCKSTFLSESDKLSLLMNIAVPGSKPLPDSFSREKYPRHPSVLKSTDDSNFIISPRENATVIIKWKALQVSSINNLRRYSPTFYIHKFPFRAYIENPENSDFLHFGLRCDFQETSDWTCSIKGSRKLICLDVDKHKTWKKVCDFNPLKRDYFFGKYRRDWLTAKFINGVLDDLEMKWKLILRL